MSPFLAPMMSGLPSASVYTDNPAADFSDTPVWLTIVKAVLLLVYILLSILVVIWFERRFLGRFQQRPGPNRFGPGGILQTLADGVKLMMQEDLRPAKADRLTFTLAPLLTATMAFCAFAIIPLGGSVWMFGHHTPLQLGDASVAVIMVLALASVGAYGIFLAGWSSGSTYPLLGGLRSTAQIISYEIAMGLALVAVFIHSGSMSTSQIVGAQHSMWFIIPLFFSFIVYVITMFGETNRVPFDLAEGEGELVAGFHTEYSSMRFGMFYVGEYINMFNVSALCTTMFLGGWQAPPGIAAINDGMFNNGWWGLLWFTIKMWLFIAVFIWVRGTLPRVRYDQFMRFGWKFLIPATLLWVVVVAFLHAAQMGFMGEGVFNLFGRAIATATLAVIGVIAALVVIAAVLWSAARDRREAAREESLAAPVEVDPFAGGFPVPPLPGQRLIEPSRGPALTGGGAVRGTATRTQTVSSPMNLTKEDDNG